MSEQSMLFVTATYIIACVLALVIAICAIKDIINRK